MSIIVQNTSVKSEILQSDEGVIFHFSDPAYARAHQVLIDPDERLVGVVLHEGIHHVKDIPQSVNLFRILSLKQANMRSNLPNGEILSLFVPILQSKFS